MRLFRLYSKIFTVSLIGRPNVGKSTLFNNLIGKKGSLVHNTPGLTRDRIEGTTTLFGVPIKFIDTAGWEPVGTENSPLMMEKMMIQTRKALFDSDLAFFLVDVRQGITTADEKLADYLKKEGIKAYPNLKDIVLVGNKCEQSFLGDISNEVYNLDLGDPVLISASHNEGLVDLYERLKESIPKTYIEETENRHEKRLERHEALKKKKRAELKELERKSGESWNIKEWERTYDKLNHPDNSDYDSDAAVDVEENIIDPSIAKETPELVRKSRAIQISVIGRPNVGKSTLINSLLGEERMITDPEAGTTRDSVYIDYSYNGRKIRLVDTAGLYRRSRGVVAKMIEEDVKLAIRYSHVVIFLFDASEGIVPMELDLAREVIDQGRVLLAVGNKWDKVNKDLKSKFVDYYTDLLYRKISLKGLNIILISANTKYNMKNMLNEIVELYEKWNTRIGTGILNRWLESFKKVQNLPSEAGSVLKIKYITQIKARPPTFYMFVNDASLMKENYMKNFTNSLCKEFNLNGISVRVLLRDKHLKAKKIHKPGFKLKKAKDMLETTSKRLKKASKSPKIIS